jgi:uracil-DNA glycosylase family 4
LIHPDFRISQDRGKWFDKGGVKMMAVYHPAFLLRNEKEKITQWYDFMKIREMLNELTK